MTQEFSFVIPPSKLVIFDYSGTLSLEAALFGSTDNLIHELKRSGLWQLGLNNLDLFWREILNPTWQEGSTTPKSYRQLMVDRVAQVLAIQDDKTAESTIRSCVSNFVDSYFNHSPIAPEWKPLFSKLSASSDVIAVVATDHYLDVTEHIFHQLKGLGFDSVSALEASKNSSPPHPIFIANSADFGFRKSSRDFWEILKKALPAQSLAQVVVVDDFVSNERKGDSYVDREQITARINKVTELVSAVFQVPVEVFPLVLEPAAANIQAAFKERIGEASQFVIQVLGAPKP